MPARSIARRVRTAASMGLQRQALVVEAAASLLGARIETAARPFSKIGRRLGDFVPPDDKRVLDRRTGPVQRDTAIVRQIGWAIRTTASLMPFRSVCLQQAIAAHAMLARRGVASVVHVGVPRGAPEPAQAHVWVDAAGIAVVGYPIGAEMVEIGCFV